MKPPAPGSKAFDVQRLRLLRAAGKRPNRIPTAGLTPAKPITAPVQASAPKLKQESTMKKRTTKKAKAPKTKKRSVSEAAANLKAAKKASTKKEPAADEPPRAGVRAGSKLEIVVGLLTRDGGCTGKEILEATGWPTVSVPQQAKAAGLMLSKEKVDGVTRYSAIAA